MKTFTAKQLHENPSGVYRTATKEPVKITHKHHGELVVMHKDVFFERISNAIKLNPECSMDISELTE